jgi:hypothetical protein
MPSSSSSLACGHRNEATIVCKSSLTPPPWPHVMIWTCLGTLRSSGMLTYRSWSYYFFRIARPPGSSSEWKRDLLHKCPIGRARASNGHDACLLRDDAWQLAARPQSREKYLASPSDLSKMIRAADSLSVR